MDNKGKEAVSPVVETQETAAAVTGTTDTAEHLADEIVTDSALLSAELSMVQVNLDLALAEKSELAAQNAVQAKTILDLQYQLDDATKALETAQAAQAELQKLVDAKTAAAVPAKTKAKSIEVAAKVDDDDFAGATVILFGDANGQVIASLPPLVFRQEQFGMQGDARVLEADIEFPLHNVASFVSTVALADGKGKIVSQCELIQPMAVCGGRGARINKGSLLFSKPVAADSKAKKAA